MTRKRKPVRRHPAKMEKLQVRAEIRARAAAADRLDSGYLSHYEQTIAGVAAYCETHGLDPARAWGTMVYACAGERGLGEGCGFEHRVWMLLGVEGPPPLRDSKLFVPAPFNCGGCPDCGGSLQHVRWPDDEEWDAPGRELPPDAAYFRLPTAREAERFAAKGYGGAEYVDPTGRTRVGE